MRHAVVMTAPAIGDLREAATYIAGVLKKTGPRLNGLARTMSGRRSPRFHARRAAIPRWTSLG